MVWSESNATSMLSTGASSAIAKTGNRSNGRRCVCCCCCWSCRTPEAAAEVRVVAKEEEEGGNFANVEASKSALMSLCSVDCAAARG